MLVHGAAGDARDGDHAAALRQLPQRGAERQHRIGEIARVRDRREVQEEMQQLERRIDMKKKELREARSAKNSASHIAYVEKDLRDLNIEMLQLRFKFAQMPQP